MEDIHNTSSSNLQLPEEQLCLSKASRDSLATAAKWAYFLSIVGFCGVGLIVLLAVFMSFFMNRAVPEMEDMPFGGGMVGFLYIFFAAIYLFPIIYLYRFSKNTKQALAANDDWALGLACSNLKLLFRYMGIFTIISLGFYAVILLLALVFGGFMSMM